MKNFVMDVSNSIGGDTYVTTYFLSFLGAGNSFYHEGSRTHNKAQDIVYFDPDQDGIFESVDMSKDYQFNYAILCSRKTFSAGNLLACRAKESGIPVLGEKSGGGTCTIIYSRTPTGLLIWTSSACKAVYKNSGDLDYGAVPDYDLTKLTPDGGTDYSDFYNYRLIDSILDDHYNNNSDN